HEVDWGGRGVIVHARTRTGRALPRVEARHAVITVPLAVLAARPPAEGAIRFAPGLPRKREAARRLSTGAVVKLALRFRSPFWRRAQVRHRAEGRLPRFSYVHVPGRPFPTWWTPRPFDVPVLVGWAG